MIWGDYLHDPFNSYSPASYVIDVGKHYSCDIISALSSLLFCFLSVMNGKYCWGRVCLRREVPAWFPDRKTISTKTFEASYSQERWNWWDLRKYVDKGLEVALFPKKLVRRATQAHLRFRERLKTDLLAELLLWSYTIMKNLNLLLSRMSEGVWGTGRLFKYLGAGVKTGFWTLFPLIFLCKSPNREDRAFNQIWKRSTRLMQGSDN